MQEVASRWAARRISALLGGTRGVVLAKTGAHAEARRAYEIAIGLERDASVRRFLQLRQFGLGALTSSPSA